ncbi:carbonic anhydrase 12-like [Amphibalanus amphitrite]|uniref:carbonic anhydrase 12-like n=1 Tax=Amphibalanus amphitrite TaxID=1232801 RepID=UPI001C8FA955|nr:carbonic anhydrase 12-like [Amphibalanus amphitrite]XP_043228802.1 carbonic anhydrase 12-like [Amphibalanus amphitrite]
MPRLCLSLTVLVSVALPARAAPVEPSWKYWAQDKWWKEFPQCGGDQQSPVELRPTEDRFWYYGRGPRVRFAKRLKAGRLTATNTGRTLSVTLENDSGQPAVQLKGSRSGLLSSRYILDNLHLHWNDPAGGRGSEHKMNGAFEQAEAHFVFFNQQYGNVSAALAHVDTRR